MGAQLPPPKKRGMAPNFRAMSIVAERSPISATAEQSSCTWRHSSLPKRGTQPQFSAHVYCGQTAGCISIPLGTEVGLGPGDIVLDGCPAPPKGSRPPILGPCLLWPNGRPSQLLLSRALVQVASTAYLYEYTIYNNMRNTR